MKKILFIAIILICVSCKSTQQIQYINKTDSIYTENTIRDSIFINQYKKEDTIFVVKEKFTVQTQYKDRVLKDTIQTVKYITKEKKASQKPFKWYFLGIITTVLIIVIGKYVKVFHFK